MYIIIYVGSNGRSTFVFFCYHFSNTDSYFRTINPKLEWLKVPLFRMVVPIRHSDNHDLPVVTKDFYQILCSMTFIGFEPRS